MKNKIALSLLAFVITFCLPALVVHATEYYTTIVTKLGKYIYETIHNE